MSISATPHGGVTGTVQAPPGMDMSMIEYSWTETEDQVDLSAEAQLVSTSAQSQVLVLKAFSLQVCACNISCDMAMIQWASI